MSEMIERVARAILRAEHGGVDADACYGYNSAGEFVPGGEGGKTKPHAWMWFKNHARAAIAAMREPTKAMLTAADPIEDPDRHDDLWRAMIDAALKAPGGE